MPSIGNTFTNKSKQLYCRKININFITKKKHTKLLKIGKTICLSYAERHQSLEQPTQKNPVCIRLGYFFPRRKSLFFVFCTKCQKKSFDFERIFFFWRSENNFIFVPGKVIRYPDSLGKSIKIK